MATHAPKLSKKQSTVLLGDLLKNMDLKDERGKLIDLAVRTSHIWSERHPERAAETIDENCVTHILENGNELKGTQNTTMFSHLLHDVLEDFHYTIHEVIAEGTLKDGKSSTRASITGKWVKPIGQVPPSNAEISVNILMQSKILNGKMVEGWSITVGPPDWDDAWKKFFLAFKQQQ